MNKEKNVCTDIQNIAIIIKWSFLNTPYKTIISSRLRSKLDSITGQPRLQKKKKKFSCKFVAHIVGM